MRWNQAWSLLQAALFLRSTSRILVLGLECQTGLGETTKVIPEDWINDGYCDCPFNGADEPNTDACSGSTLWPGLLMDDESDSHPPLFQCPQQPKLLLPTSRLDDGICDCCDGADETTVKCVDNCEEVLREEREARAKLAKDFQKGHAKRKQDVFDFKQLRKEKLATIETLQADVVALESHSGGSDQLMKLKQAYRSLRLKTVQDVFLSYNLFKGVSTDELKAILVHTCQLAGEIDTSRETTCIPLRLATLEMGWTWEDDDFQEGIVLSREKDDESQQQQVMDRLFSNAANDESEWLMPGQPKSKSSQRRRLDEILDDEKDDYDEYMGDDEYDYYGEEEEELASDDEDDDDSADEDDEDDIDLNEIQKQLIREVAKGAYSRPRTNFLVQERELTDRIKNLEDAMKEEENDEEDDEETIDPAGAAMAKNGLRRKKAQINKGLMWGSAASLFLESCTDATYDELTQLAMGVTYHGNLSSAQVWEILANVVPGLSDSVDASPESCVAPWAGTCPPKTIVRDGGVKIPSVPLLQTANGFCGEAASRSQEGLCAGPTDDPSDVPMIIPDGYAGYYSPSARDEDDPISAVFEQLSALPFDKESADKFESENEALKASIKEKKKEIEDIYKEIGGADGAKMGINGELYPMADECFEVTAGKYTYELCVFGEAKQKEGKTGGTGLGKWSHMEIDETTGDRLLLWTNGAQCWNGPKRSATAQVTCGSETKVLSADEPDTCRYVLQMESPIACDEAFRTKNDL